MLTGKFSGHISHDLCLPQYSSFSVEVTQAVSLGQTQLAVHILRWGQQIQPLRCGLEKSEPNRPSKIFRRYQTLIFIDEMSIQSQRKDFIVFNLL